MSFVWDGVSSMRPVVQGEPGEFYWDGSSWVANPLGGNQLWDGATGSWGPSADGGDQVWNGALGSWAPVTQPGFGGTYYWDGSIAWTLNTSDVVTNERVTEDGDERVTEAGEVRIVE